MYAAFALLLVIAVDRYGNEPTLKNAVILIVCGIIYGLLRKNGFYSLLFTFVVLVFLWLKRDFRKTVTVFATMLILITVIERPIYSAALSVLNKNVITAQSDATLMLEDESMATDAYSISFRRGENTKTNEVHFRGNFLYVMFFQQVANVVCHDRKLTAEEEHMIEEMIPISVIKKTYNPMLVDELFNMATAYATEEAHYYLDTIMEETARLDGMVKDLLELSSIENGLARLRLARVDISALSAHFIEKAAVLLTPYRLEAEIAPGLAVRGDAHYLSQALGNFITNAIAHTREGGRIAVSLRETEGSAVFRVYNEGAPIADEDMEHIWESFYRADKARTQTEEKHVGLGLYIVKSIVEAHHGSYGVQNEESGVAFFFSVPLWGTSDGETAQDAASS